MASFDVVNYTIRPNKNIERKLVFESLRELSTPLGLGDYRYIGLGSPWFIDFLLAHRYLLIRDMICIEFEEHAPRMEFNKPYDCIAVPRVRPARFFLSSISHLDQVLFGSTTIPVRKDRCWKMLSLLLIMLRRARSS